MNFVRVITIIYLMLILGGGCLRRGAPSAGDAQPNVAGEEGGMTAGQEGSSPVNMCSVGLGICFTYGELQVRGGQEICDAEPLPSSVERCGTGLDEDCDGVINEGFPSYGQNCDDKDELGNSIYGSFDCSEDRLSLVCKVTDNTCDGIDNDADGRVDEGYLTQSIDCPAGSCAPQGFLRCIGGGLISTCQPLGAQEGSPELCDGFDNDCDGIVDEDQFVEPIWCGVGECQAEGRRVCMNGAFQDVCTMGIPQEEACNEAGTPPADEDCDGRVNEGFQFSMCPVCSPGTTPSVEQCDGLDNDCDGYTDEDLLNACGFCGAKPDEVCDGLDNDCDGTADEGLINRCGFCGPLPEERCDELDNDCDGTVDEGLGMPTDLIGICEGTLTVCRGGQMVVPEFTMIPGYEGPNERSCDLLDNDCDGRVDEDVQVISDLPGVCTGLINSCENGRVIFTDPALAVPDYEQPEVSSDGLDNDCDGIIDEYTN